MNEWDLPQSLGFIDERSLLHLSQQLPLCPQPLGDLGIVHLRIVLRHLTPLTPWPHHKGIHRPLYVVIGLFTQRHCKINFDGFLKTTSQKNQFSAHRNSTRIIFQTRLITVQFKTFLFLILCVLYSKKYRKPINSRARCEKLVESSMRRFSC